MSLAQRQVRGVCRYSEAQPARPDADADATVTAGSHGLVKHRGHGSDALQDQVIAKLGRQVTHPAPPGLSGSGYVC